MLQLFDTYVLSRLNNKKGQEMVEYALLIGLIAIVVIGALILFVPPIS
ncbi:Flp family type IVb pilin [Cellulosilyticum sp. I15G10I2]|nr:Flp family type IVb pilin [Cellulosilyticum sp. I15G10I2]